MSDADFKLHDAEAAIRPRSARIFLDSLEVKADIGFHEFEIGSPQRVLISVDIWLDEIPDSDCDDPASAWDYDFVRQEVEAIVSGGRFNLQESLANAVFERFSAMHGVRALRVVTAKPDIYRNARAVGVELASFTGPAPEA